MIQDLEYIIVGALGGLTLECLQVPVYRNRLTLEKYKALFREPIYWICTGMLVCGAGIAAWGFNQGNSSRTLTDVYITGIAARSIIRELITAKTSAAKMGGKLTAKDLFS